MVFPESRLRDIYRVAVWDLWRPASGLLPPGSELRGNRALGRLAHRLSRAKRRAVLANLRRGLPERRDHEVLASQVFQTHFADQYVSWTFSRIARGQSYLDLSGRELLDRALERGGVVLMHAHMGLAQLPLCTLGAMGYPVHQVGGGGVAHALSPTGERVTALRCALEQQIPARLWDGRGYLRPLLRVLQRGGVVLAACDGTGGGEELGRRVERRVLGQRMLLPVGPVWLALRSGATLMGLCTFHERGRERSVLEELEQPTDLEEGADLVASCMERWLRAHPGDWHLWDEFEPGRLLL